MHILTVTVTDTDSRCPGGRPTAAYTFGTQTPATGSQVNVCAVGWGLRAGSAAEPLWTKKPGASASNQCCEFSERLI